MDVIGQLNGGELPERKGQNGYFSIKTIQKYADSQNSGVMRGFPWYNFCESIFEFLN